MNCVRRPHALWTTCKCPKCLRHMQRVRKAAHMDRLPRTQSERAVARIQHWDAQGYSSGWIASAIGAPRAWVITIVNGTVTTPGPILSERVIKGDITQGSAGFCPSLGARRRLRALAVMGWGVVDLSEQTGIPAATISRIRNGEAREVSAARFHLLTETYERLHMRRGPSVQGATRALNKGWLPPLAWDDIDDPNETPTATDDTPGVDEVAVQRRLDGDDTVTLTRAERWVAVQRLAAQGLSDRQIGRRLGCTDRTVLRDRQQLGAESRWVA